MCECEAAPIPKTPVGGATGKRVRFETHVEVEADGAVAVDALSAASGLSKQAVKRAMTSGAVWLAKGGKARRLRRAKTRLRRGDSLDLYFDNQVLDTRIRAPELLDDKGGYTVWYKPFGMLAQGSKWGDHCSLVRAAEKTLIPERPAYIVHRIDRAATGLMLLAHDRRTAAKLSAIFQARTIDKRYRAVVHGRLTGANEGTVSIAHPIGGRDAVTYVDELAFDALRQRSLLEVRIDTGRKHQIRVHLAGENVPIVGDRLHGVPGDREDLQLTAYRLVFQCPISGREVRYELDHERLPSLGPGDTLTGQASSIGDSS